MGHHSNQFVTAKQASLSGSFALTLDDPQHKADNYDYKQDRQPYPAVSIHPADAPHASIHHVSVLR
jgi:hypothetical protein